MFADDTNLTVSGDSIADLETAVKSDLEKLREWIIANKLSLNVAKTEFFFPNTLLKVFQICSYCKCEN